MSNIIVTVKTSENICTIEANEYSDMSPILGHVAKILKDYQITQGVSNFDIEFIINGDQIKQVIHAFLKCIEMHAKERVKLKGLEVCTIIISFLIIYKKELKF